MARKTIKKITNEELKFIPEDMLDLDEKAKDMFDRPIIVYGKKLTNSQKWEMRELLEIEVKGDSTKVKGTGKAVEYVWKKCVTKVCNVVFGEGKDREEHAELTGDEKDNLWDATLGLEELINASVEFFQGESELNDEEVKTSV